MPNLATAAQDHTSTDRAQAALKRGVDWLLAQQAPDGGWHSTTYGQMRSGIGNTALAVYALAHLPQPLRDEVRPHFERGVKFLLANLDDRGFPRTADNSVDYPTYATALLLAALERTPDNQWLDERQKLRTFLTTTSNANEDRGGWSSVGNNLGTAVPSEHANISATSLALEALATAGGLPATTKTNALPFLARCQNFNRPSADGGFFFTPAPNDPLNKAGVLHQDTQHPTARSYGTATIDGLLALHACGVPTTDARTKAALNWLAQHPARNNVPGFPADSTEANLPSDAMRYYFYFSLARATRQLHDPVLSKQLADAVEPIIQSQQPTGAWTNPSTAMREDDPLIATPFAVIALSTHLQRK